jgi:hypothetical protein
MTSHTASSTRRRLRLGGLATVLVASALGGLSTGAGASTAVATPPMPTLPPAPTLPKVPTLTPGSLGASGLGSAGAAWASYFAKDATASLAADQASLGTGSTSIASTSFAASWAATKKSIGMISSPTGGLAAPVLPSLPKLSMTALPSLSLPSLPSVAAPSLSASQLDATLGQGASFTLSPPPAWSTIALNPVYGGLGGATKAFAASAGCAARTTPSATCLAGISDSALSSALSASGMSAASSPSALIKLTGTSQHELASALNTSAMTKELTTLTGTAYAAHGSFNPALSSVTHGLTVGKVLHTEFSFTGWLASHL